MARASSICAKLASAGSKLSTNEHYGAVVSGLSTTGIFAAARLHLRCMSSTQLAFAGVPDAVRDKGRTAGAPGSGPCSCSAPAKAEEVQATADGGRQGQRAGEQHFKH